jgi:TFIIF-interacting CTD phosphatase-like protein
MILQLEPQIPLITPKGNGQAVLVIDYSEEHDLKWVVIQDDTGEVWTWKNEQVRGFKNVTMGRIKISPIKNEQ